MIKIILPREDVNSEKAKIIKWRHEPGDFVKKEDILVEFETDKSVFELESPAEGILLILSKGGEEADFNSTIGILFDSMDEYNKYGQNQVDLNESSQHVNRKAATATKKAVQLAEQYKINLDEINKQGIITEVDVKNHLETIKGISTKDMLIMEPGETPSGLKKVMVFGAGFGGMQVIDILLHYNDIQIVGCLDDNESVQSKQLFSVPVLGKMREWKEMYENNVFTHAIISISTNINIRQKFYNELKEFKVPLVNAICPSVRINRTTVIGEGNVICSNSHIGICTTIGNNNFISSNSSIEHHNLIGSHNTTGPCFNTSSRVKIGDRNKFGMNIGMQPGISIGNDCLIASGIVLTKSIDSKSSVKIISQIQILENKI